MTTQASNFAFLQVYDKSLARLGMLAENYFPDDPNTSMMKIRQFAETLSHHVAAHSNVDIQGLNQHDLLRKLEYLEFLPTEPTNICDYFHTIRRTGNNAVHKLYDRHS